MKTVSGKEVAVDLEKYIDERIMTLQGMLRCAGYASDWDSGNLIGRIEELRHLKDTLSKIPALKV